MTDEKDNGQNNSDLPAENKDWINERQKMVSSYFKGSQGLLHHLKNQNKDKPTSLILALVEEIVHETDNLLGAERLSAQKGDFKNSSVASFKRVEALEKATKAVQTHLQFQKENSIDLDSPYVEIIFNYFMRKTREAFKLSGYKNEASDVFFKMLSRGFSNWKKELQQEIDDMTEM